MTFMRLSLALLAFLALPSLSAAYTWNFQAPPQQCSNLSISISGSDGKPPYRVLILPFGPTPLAGNVEARRIVDQPFNGDSASISFKLNYPANSQLVAVPNIPLATQMLKPFMADSGTPHQVSDATGFGSGGTSVAAQVTASSDSSCFDASSPVSPEFVFSIEPANQFVQCRPMRIWWDKATVKGTPNFLGIIPGGQSFAIPESNITDVETQGTGFTWTPSVRGGTTLILAGGDDRGNGTAGSTLNTVNNGINNDGSCLSDASPSSTAGSPAGGSYPTGPVSSGGGGGGGGTNTGAIVGGVIGGVVVIVALLLLLLFFRRRSRLHKKQKERPLDLLHADEGDEGDESFQGGAPGRAGRNELPEYYQPEPFMVPDPTLAASSADGHTATGTGTSDGRPLSGYTSATSRSGTPDLLGSVYGGMAGGSSTSGGGGRKGAMKHLRPVNVIQHDDAGPRVEDGAEGEVETVELPPAYTNIRK